MSYYLDLDTWPRREVFEFYRRFDKPDFNVCLRVDVTELLNELRRRGYVWVNTDENGNPKDFSVRWQHGIPYSSPLNVRWAKYLREIQDENDYPNWLSAPYTFYLSPRPD